MIVATSTSFNETRIASLLGTWTSTVRVKAFLGNYQLLTYFVLHLMPNPTREYRCSRSDCNEIDNEVCVKQYTTQNTFQSKCVNLTDEVVEWSDVSAFLYFGSKVDAGIPFNIHQEHNTGGWVGPFSLIFAQDPSINGENQQQDNQTITLDRYFVRYANTPTTPYLHMNPNNTLVSQEEDFNRYMGPLAVNETIVKQPHVTAETDPYEQYLKTCEHGNVKPILPLFDFTFVQDKETAQERVNVKFNYKLLSIPQKGDIMYKVFPWMQSRVNRRQKDFHISGPYCYGDDAKRGYTFDLTYDSTQESQVMTLIHGCAKGYPCLPSAAKLGTEDADSIIHNATKIDTGDVDAGAISLLMFALYFLLLALLVALTCNCRLRRRLRHQRALTPLRRRAAAADPGPFGDLGEDNDLTEPLVENKQDDTKEESVSESARVEFV